MRSALSEKQYKRRADLLRAVLAVGGPTLTVTGIVVALTSGLVGRPLIVLWPEYIITMVTFAVGVTWTYAAWRWRLVRTPVREYYKAMKSGVVGGLLSGLLMAYAVIWAASIYQ